MPQEARSTIGEVLYWSYANLGMMENTLECKLKTPGKQQYMIRSKLYAGLCSRSMHVRGFFDDEKLKIKFAGFCWYCGTTKTLSVDHIIPQSKGGLHGGENLIYSCRSCNSSKGSTDLLVWMQKRNQFPPLYLLRRYLKIVIEYCQQHDLLAVPLPVEETVLEILPFIFEAIPQKFPPVDALSLFVVPTDAPE